MEDKDVYTKCVYVSKVLHIFRLVHVFNKFLVDFP